MNIQKINLEKFTTYNEQKSVNSSFLSPKYGLKMSAPLAYDSITFKSKRTKKALEILKAALRLAEQTTVELEEANSISVKELPAEQKIWKINKQDADRIHTQILKYQEYVRSFIHNLFDDLIYSEKNQKNPILQIHECEKQTDSIIEKAATLKLKSIDEIFDNITDLNRAKLVFRKKAGRNEVDSALDRFIPMIKTGQAELREIEIKLPESIKSLPKKEQKKYIYSSMSMLKKLVEVQESIWNTKNTSKENIRKVKFGKPQYTKGNYCAVHMLWDLPNKDANIFELQIVGAYVGLGKELDDIIFKLLDGKEVKKQYKPIAQRIRGLKEDSTGALDRFLQYRKDANLALREREIQEAENNKITGKNVKLYISAEKYNLPYEYDLNSLMELKEDCDRKAAITKKKFEQARIAKQEKETRVVTDQKKHSLPYRLNKIIRSFPHK